MKIPKRILLCFLVACLPSFMLAQFRVACPKGNLSKVVGNPGDTLTVCFNDGQPDLYRIYDSQFRSVQAALLTDINNVILYVDSRGVFDFEALPKQPMRAYSFGYIGRITATPGQRLDTALLGSYCHSLAPNFITIQFSNPEVGAITTSAGTNSRLVCPGDGKPDLVRFRVENPAGGNLRFLLTDQNNKLLQVIDGDSYNFENDLASVPGYRVYGIVYGGNLSVQPGDDVTKVILASACSSLANGFVTISKNSPSGGSLTLADGSTRDIVCVNDNLPDTAKIIVTGNTPGDYLYIVTNESGTVLSTSTTPNISLAGLNAGTIRIYGVSYTGAITIQPGQSVVTAPVSDACFDISDNFVVIARQTVLAGQISFSNGTKAITVCVNDKEDDLIGLTTTGSTASRIAYIGVDKDNKIVSVFQNAIVNVETSPRSLVRIYSLAYEGQLAATIGSSIASGILATECYQLSTSFVEINQIPLAGGSIALGGNGGVNLAYCYKDGDSRVITLEKRNDSGEFYQYVLTDLDGRVLRILGIGISSFESDESTPLQYRIQGISYLGELTVNVGDALGTTQLATGCFALSDNSITVVKKRIDAGQVVLQGGASEALACVKDNKPDVFTFANSSTAAATSQYAYVITTEDDRILSYVSGNSINLDVASPAVCRIYGLSFTGSLLGTLNRVITDIPLSSDCYELTENYVTITKEQTNGGVIALENNSTSITFCPESTTRSTRFTFKTTSQISNNYDYLITNSQDIIIGRAFADGYDFRDAPLGDCRVYGVSYTGIPTANLGENIKTGILSSGCYSLSSNFITVRKEVPNAGQVTTLTNETSIFICPETDKQTVTFKHSNTAFSNGFLLTDTSNVLIEWLDGAQKNFSEMPNGDYRVWGLAYTGNLKGRVAGRIDTIIFSDDCFGFSENFVEINKETPTIDSLELTNGSLSAIVCPTTSQTALVSLKNNNIGKGRIAYFIVNANNSKIAGFAFNRNIDMSEYPEGDYRIYAAVFTGSLSVQVGNVFSGDSNSLGEGCYAVTPNYIKVSNVLPSVGAIRVTGSTQTQFQYCGGDRAADLLRFESGVASGGLKAIAISNPAGQLVALIEGTTVDFDSLSCDTCLARYVSYTGDVTIKKGDIVTQNAISDKCYAVSPNFITVFRTAVDGGAVLSASGTSTEYICSGDGTPDVLTFFNTSKVPGASYKYILATDKDVVLAEIQGNQRDFDRTTTKALTIWGVSYTGTFQLNAGKKVSEAVFSNGCYSTSREALKLFLDKPEGGLISAGKDATEIKVCPGNGQSKVTFKTSSVSRAGYRYVLTDRSDKILDILRDSTFDFATLTPGAYRVWAVSYTGTLTAAKGSVITAISLSSSCHELSANNIEVDVYQGVSPGVLSTADGKMVYNVCPRNATPDIVEFESSGDVTVASYRFILTDGDNRIIIPSFPGNISDFNNTPRDGVYKIYGVSFTGRFLGSSGMDIDERPLSDSCYAVTPNPIVVNVFAPNGGTVATTDGLTTVPFIQNGNQADVRRFTKTGASPFSYAFVLTYANDTIIQILPSDSLDLSMFSIQSNLKVWGVSYVGTLDSAQAGKHIQAATFASDCYAVSSNQVLLVPSAPGKALPNRTEKEQLHVKLSPVPVTDWLQVNWDASAAAQTVRIEILDVAGNVMLSKAINNTSSTELFTGNLQHGFYTLRLYVGNTMTAQKFIR